MAWMAKILWFHDWYSLQASCHTYIIHYALGNKTVRKHKNWFSMAQWTVFWELKKFRYNKFSVDLSKSQALFSVPCTSALPREITDLCWLVKMNASYIFFPWVAYFMTYFIICKAKAKSFLKLAFKCVAFVIFLIVTFPLRLLLIFSVACL